MYFGEDMTVIISKFETNSSNGTGIRKPIACKDFNINH